MKLINDITLDTNHDSYGRFVQIVDSNLYDGFGQTISIIGSTSSVDDGCCDEVKTILDSIESDISKIKYVQVPVVQFRDVIKEVIVTEVIQTTIYVNLPPCSPPRPPKVEVIRPTPRRKPCKLPKVNIPNNSGQSGAQTLSDSQIKIIMRSPGWWIKYPCLAKYKDKYL